MFSGIVEDKGKVVSFKEGILTVHSNLVLEDLKVKESISVNGACLTVTERTGELFKVDVVPETIRKTNLGLLKEGDWVNLERSTRLGDRIGGHLVQGHVDCTCLIKEIVGDGTANIMEFEVPSDVMKYIVQKGFVCVDGVSLTVVECAYSSFSITLIPYTGDHTVLGVKSVGDLVNLEVDMIAKYVESVVDSYK